MKYSHSSTPFTEEDYGGVYVDENDPLSMFVDDMDYTDYCEKHGATDQFNSELMGEPLTDRDPRIIIKWVRVSDGLLSGGEVNHPLCGGVTVPSEYVDETSNNLVLASDDSENNINPED